MPFARQRRLALLLLALFPVLFTGQASLAQDLLGGTENAQEDEATAEPTMPALDSLREDWWAYFEGPQDAVGARIEAFLEELEAQIGDLAPQNQEIAADILAATRDNFQVYRSLLAVPDVELEPLPEPAAAYTIDELLETAAQAREARVEANSEIEEVEREQRVLSGVTRRRDATFKDYLDAEPGDERWLDGLRLVRVRASQAVATRRLAILKQSADAAVARADHLGERVDLIIERLEPAADEEKLERLEAAIAEAEALVAAKENAAHEAQTAASGLDVDTPAFGDQGS